MFDYNGLKEYLENNGIKQSFVATKINISPAMLNAILTGRVKCSLESYVAICKTLDFPLGKFLRLDEVAVD